MVPGQNYFDIDNKPKITLYYIITLYYAVSLLCFFVGIILLNSFKQLES